MQAVRITPNFSVTAQPSLEAFQVGAFGQRHGFNLAGAQAWLAANERES